ncbi:exodeoxyribonuclease V subunit alpha [Variovorax sp. OV329]|uniref:exodeoxyribonuclease V subunit alpha n=1 Tax=Variovorax sp. OV329 TaxID=1882825 RepID=UPI0008DF0F74|nr:exodeoxyribonuclease V subunit alpha [Variovorax sp. OV329]SFL93608.1 DNA helicase/exodeoxyribonuclease V, alpha subunit [Variovorax sp. OV329]
MSASVFLGPLPDAHAPVLDAIEGWVQAGWLRELDRSLAAFFSRLAPAAEPLVILAAALASHQLGRGHACLDLRATLEDAGRALSLPPEGGAPVQDAVAGVAVEAPSHWLRDVSLKGWISALDAQPELVGDGPGATPLVRVGRRLYLRRYWQYEQSVRAEVARRVALPTAAAQPEAQAAVAATLDVLFPKRADDGEATDWQKVACALSARQAFSIVTGGPGTGKTTTVVRLLALLQHLALSSGGARLRIGLAAPTGKAAARLGESIAGAVAGLPFAQLSEGDALRAAIPTTVSTVHRLLGSRPDTRHFRHDARNPLPLDVLVLDEASMLDLEMMACVLAALRPQARLILLGDKDQLASVEAGAVLGDLCQRADAGHYDAATVHWLEAVTGQRIDAALRDDAGRPLDQAVVKLRRSYRFDAGSGIGRLAEAVNNGDESALRQLLAGGHADLSTSLQRVGQATLDDAALRRLVVDGAPDAFASAGKGRKEQGRAVPPPVGYGHYLRLMRAQQPEADASQEAHDEWAREVLKALGRFQLLCALRGGPQGVQGLNPRIAGLLRAQGLLEPELGGWYAGRPVLVTRNDYALGLMNGDVGVALSVPFGASAMSGAQGSGDALQQRRLRVAFPASDQPGGIRWVLPSRLRSVDTVFAMTVHKSQGSEFSHAALLLPQQLSPVLTRELVYTGITRARHWFTLAAAPDMVLAAAARRVERVGGLSEGGDD